MAGDIDAKYITVQRLRELLTELPDDWLIYTRTLADTGDLPFVDNTVGPVGYINIREEIVVRYDTESP